MTVLLKFEMGEFLIFGVREHSFYDTPIMDGATMRWM